MKHFLQQTNVPAATPTAIAASGPTRMEARTAILEGGVVLGADGVASGFKNETGSITFRLAVARGGLYGLRLLVRATGGEKECVVRVGGGPALTAHLPRTTGAAPVVVEAGLVELVVGPTTLTIEKGWGYYEIAGVELSPASAITPLRPVPAVPVDPKATPAARRLLKRITAHYGKATLSGQYDPKECEYVQSLSGKLPAVLGEDLIEYSPSRREHGSNPKNLVERLIQTMQITKPDKQPLLTLSWHWNAPLGLLDKEITNASGKVIDARWYRGFYTEATTFDFAAALADPKSEGYKLLLRDIDVIAGELVKFARADIPILWRPLHEADGGWFWWGTKGPQAFVQLWRLLYDRLTTTHNLHNLIWVTSSGMKPDWYPGDKYVDIVGIDAYPQDPADPLVGNYRTLLSRFDGKKPLALTEFGGIPDVARMLRYGVRWAYFVSWTGNVGPRKMGPEGVKKLYTAPGVVNRKRIEKPVMEQKTTLAPSALAATPPMGWNSWNMFGSHVHENNLRETADALVSLGLRDCGYQYLVIDDCWSVRESRDRDGNLVADPHKFPNGIKALADYVHDLGFKIGIYSDAAEKTCAGYPGSLGFEEQDAQLWASWGIDFLKYDYCAAPNDQATAIERYGSMGAALRGTGREILFSLCEWGGRSPHLWGPSVGGHMWRVSGDVFDSWVNIWMKSWNSYGIGVDVSIDTAAELQDFGGPGRWNDLDMLVVGLKGKGHISGGGMSFLEYQTHMSLWCMACSPLMIGCDVRTLDAETAGLLMNREVLAINQDPLGISARRVRQLGPCEIWKKPLADGSVAVALLNRGASGSSIPVRARDIGLLDTPKTVRNVWDGDDIADFDYEMDAAGRAAPNRSSPSQAVVKRQAKIVDWQANFVI